MSFRLACAESDLDPADVIQVTLEGTELALARDSDGSWHALGDQCTHDDVSLGDGDVDDGGLECWKHGSVFDLRTGRPRSLPAIRPVPVYPVRVDAGSVWVDIDSPAIS